MFKLKNNKRKIKNQIMKKKQSNCKHRKRKSMEVNQLEKGLKSLKNKRL
jgi:hypothetical protein